MNRPGEMLVEFLAWLAPRKAGPLTIVECGTIRTPSFDGHHDGLATFHIARWLATQPARHEFVSFELSHGTMVQSRAFLASAGLADRVTFGLGDAEVLLEHFNQLLDVCYLDAGASPVANLAQYRRAEKWMRAPGAIIIDDVFDPRNADRGLVTVPYARLDGRRVACLDARQALISFGIDDYPLPEGSYWLDEVRPSC